MTFRRVFGNLSSPVPLSYLDDNFGQLGTASTATATLYGASLVGYLQSGSATARTVQSRLQERISVKDFGAAGDGVTDDTAAIDAAISYCGSISGALYFPAGTYAFSETVAGFGLYINQALTVIGDGNSETTLKNMSATGVGMRCAATVNLSGFTIYQNGSTGKGLIIGGQYSHVNVKVENQAGSNYAVNIDGATCADVFIEVLDSTNCVRLGETSPTNYVRLRAPTLEANSGVCLKAEICSGCTFDVYVDTNATGNQTKLIDIDNCSEIDIILSCETGNTHTLTDPAYFDIARSKSINFRGGRINHTGTASKTIFRLTGTTLSNGVTWDGMEIISTQTGMTLFDLAGSASSFNIGIDSIVTNLTSAATGVICSLAQQLLRITNWNNRSAAASHTLDAVGLFCANVEGDIAVASRARQTFLNCGGTFSGTGATTSVRVNSDSSTPGVKSGTATVAAAGIALTFVTPGDLSVTYASRDVTYTVNGNGVVVRANIATATFTHSTASGALRLTGALPFTPAKDSYQFAMIDNASGLAGGVMVKLTAGQTYLEFWDAGTGAIGQVLVGDMPTGVNKTINFTISYEV